jgi:hypothetical protein
MGIIESHPIMLEACPKQPCRRSSPHRQTGIARRGQCCLKEAPVPATCRRWVSESRASRLADEVSSAAFGEPVLHHLHSTRQRAPGKMWTASPSVFSWTASRRTMLRNAARPLSP